MVATSTSLPPPVRQTFAARDVAALAAISIGVFLIALDLTIVAIALPDIQQRLGASYSAIQWLLNGYTLAFSSLLLSVGSLADRFGRRRIFLAGLAAFGVSSVLCAVAPSSTLLNLARLVQGASGAMMLPSAISLLAHRFDGHRRTLAFATFGTTFGLGLVTGPMIGGALVFGFGWPAVFLLNLPVTALAFMVGRAVIDESSDPAAARLDIAGLLLSTAALTCLFFALISSGDEAVDSRLLLAAIVGALVLGAAFVAVERRQAYPMVDLSLFGNRSFVGMSMLTLLQGASFWCLPVYLPLFLQNVRSYSAFEASLVLLPVTLPLLLLPHLGARLARTVSPPVFLGVGMIATGLGILLVSRLSPDADWRHFVPGLAVAGIATGLFNNQITNLSVAIVPVVRAGMASGINSMFRHVGYGAGIAGLGSILRRVSELVVQNSPAASFSVQAASAARTGDGSLLATHLTGTSTDPIAIAHSAFTQGLSAALAVAGLISIAAGFLTWMLVRTADLNLARQPQEFTPAG